MEKVFIKHMLMLGAIKVKSKTQSFSFNCRKSCPQKLVYLDSSNLEQNLTFGFSLGKSLIFKMNFKIPLQMMQSSFHEICG